MREEHSATISAVAAHSLLPQTNDLLPELMLGFLIEFSRIGLFYEKSLSQREPDAMFKWRGINHFLEMKLCPSY